MRRVFILVVTSFIALFVSDSLLVNGQSTPPKQKLPRLIVELIADKVVYRPKDDINLKVMVKMMNCQMTSLSTGIWALDIPQVSPFSGVTLRDGKCQRGLLTIIGNPPNLGDPNTFVKLSSGTFLGIGYENSIYNLHLEKPGKYKIWVEYHSPISKSEAKVASFWGSEDGNVKSNVWRFWSGHNAAKAQITFCYF